ncbi:MAG: hypothetical protein U0X76_09915 [Bacteroidia bacterium]
MRISTQWQWINQETEIMLAANITATAYSGIRFTIQPEYKSDLSILLIQQWEVH